MFRPTESVTQLKLWQATRENVKTLANGQTYATVKGDPLALRLARKHGTFLGKSRFWFTAAAWAEFNNEVSENSF